MREKKKALEREFEIRNKQGLNARPAALFVQTANQFESGIESLKEDAVVSGKSIMGIMTLAAEAGSTVMVRIKGADAADAGRSRAPNAWRRARPASDGASGALSPGQALHFRRHAVRRSPRLFQDAGR